MGWLYERKGCSFFPDGNYESCCDAHDAAYQEQRVSRLEADQRLYDCVEARAGRFVAGVMYAGVRLFGWIRWNRLRRKQRVAVQSPVNSGEQ